MGSSITQLSGNLRLNRLPNYFSSKPGCTLHRLTAVKDALKHRVPISSTVSGHLLKKTARASFLILTLSTMIVPLFLLDVHATSGCITHCRLTADTTVPASAGSVYVELQRCCRATIGCKSNSCRIVERWLQCYHLGIFRSVAGRDLLDSYVGDLGGLPRSVTRTCTPRPFLGFSLCRCRGERIPGLR